MSRPKFLFIALALLTGWRLALLPTQELGPDEAFIALQASRPWGIDFSLHGPLPGWLAWLSMSLAGHGPFGVRLLAPLLAAACSWMVWRLARGVFDRHVAGWSLVILNLLPAFNLAAVSWTPSILVTTSLLGSALCLRRVLTQAHHRDRWWMGAGGCLVAAFLSSPGAVVGIAAVGAALALPRRRRHHLRERGFLILLATAAPAILLWLIWQSRHGWPLGDSGAWRPDLWLIPGWFRWVILISPLLLIVFLLAFRSAVWRATDRGSSSLILGFTLPLAAVDLFYGPNDRWPEMGLSAWMAFAAIFAGHFAVTARLPRLEDRISWRTITLGFAALQTVFLLNTDFVRTLGLPWQFQKQTTGTDWVRFFTQDPSGTQRGWKTTATLLQDALVSTQFDADTTGRYFVIARTWGLASCLNASLPEGAPCLWPTPTHPRVHALQDPADFSHPFAFQPRYDAQSGEDGSPFAGQDALYITDDPDHQQPPREIRRAFDHTRLLTLTRVIHGGWEVREVRIFACYGYRPPDF
ncbi:MAG: glycosyltransferase family 39 protein [Verrucomicrobiales bacterium]|nr:glycosyltransferase family 39 protein [Verrucomicrobiales bacterium]